MFRKKMGISGGLKLKVMVMIKMRVMGKRLATKLEQRPDILQRKRW